MRINMNPNISSSVNAPYPFDEIRENLRMAREKFPQDYIVDFGVGDPTDPVPEIVREKITSAIEIRKNSGYPSSLGHPELKLQISNWFLKRFGVKIDPRFITVTYGGKYTSFHIPLYFIDPKAGEYCLIPNPGYPPYTSGALLSGANIYYLNLTEENNFEIDLEVVPKEIAKKSKLLFLNSPHSPTGRSYSCKRLESIVKYCLENEIIIISDECYSELYFNEPPLSIFNIPGAQECSIVLNSLSKRSAMTSLVIGFFASFNSELRKVFNSITSKSTQGVANIIQDGGKVAYSDETHVEKMREGYKEKLSILLPALKRYGFNPIEPDGTFFLWVKVPPGEASMDFSRKLLLEKGINTVPGDLISHEFQGVNPGAGFLRFALVPSVDDVRKAVQRLSTSV